MTLKEALLSKKPFKRPDWDHWMRMNESGEIANSPFMVKHHDLERYRTLGWLDFNTKFRYLHVCDLDATDYELYKEERMVTVDKLLCALSEYQDRDLSMDEAQYRASFLKKLGFMGDDFT